MVRERVPLAPPLAELPIGAVGHLLAWEKNEADGTLAGLGAVGAGHWWAACAQGGPGPCRQSGPAGGTEAYQQVLRRVCALDGKFRDAG